jgi:hypothetical protein
VHQFTATKNNLIKFKKEGGENDWRKNKKRDE